MTNVSYTLGKIYNIEGTGDLKVRTRANGGFFAFFRVSPGKYMHVNCIARATGGDVMCDGENQGGWFNSVWNCKEEAFRFAATAQNKWRKKNL